MRQYMITIFQSLTSWNTKEIITIILNIAILVAAILLLYSLVKLITSFKDYMKSLVKKKVVQKNGIEIINDYKEKNDYKMPVTVEDVKWYLEEVKKLYPKCLKNIETIILTDRGPMAGKQILATFYPKGGRNGLGIIKLYPLKYSSRRDAYLLGISEKNYVQIAFSEEQARRLQLFCLGHELGHNKIYLEGGSLHGQEIEDACDLFSENLDIVGNPEKEGKVITPDTPFPPLKTLKKATV